MSEAASTEWKKSSFSIGSTACVEVRRVGEETAIRHSRFPAGEQTYSRSEIAAFLAGVKAGEFDYLID